MYPVGTGPSARLPMPSQVSLISEARKPPSGDCYGIETIPRFLASINRYVRAFTSLSGAELSLLYWVHVPVRHADGAVLTTKMTAPPRNARSVRPGGQIEQPRRSTRSGRVWPC